MNYADSERLAGYYETRGFSCAKNKEEADVIVINTCMVKQAAEDRLYSMVHNLKKNNPPRHKRTGQAQVKVIVTGCFVGAMEREPSGQMKKYVKQRMPEVDEFLSMDEVGFSAHLATLGSGPTQSAKADMSWEPLRKDKKSALLPISNGCNNMCSYCIVPWSRGQEISRSFEEIVNEAEDLASCGYSEITLLGQNVNSYGADLFFLDSRFRGNDNKKAEYELPNGKIVKPIMVKSMGRSKTPTLFPYLLEEIAKIKVSSAQGGSAKGLKVNFMSSNPWDFSDELIEVIAKNKNIKREIHLPVQSGDDEILKKMNRHYTREDYLNLIKKICEQVSGVSFTTDIIVGFPGETEKQFQNTVDLCKQVNFNIAFISCYSPRPGTVAEKMEDSIEWKEKKRRFHVLDKIINTHSNKK